MSNFNKGSELDKQIYKEGTPTWGCKDGVLDVEDVKGFMILIQNKIIADQGASDYVLNGNQLIDFIKEKAGSTFALSEQGEGGSK